MKRSMIAAAACAAVFGIAAPAAQAQNVDRCEITATWHVTWVFFGDTYADRVLGPVPAGCADVPQTVTVKLDWVAVGAEPIFRNVLAGRATNEDEGVDGVFRFTTPDTFDAKLTMQGSGFTASEVHRAAGGCGDSCYATEVILHLAR